MTVCIPKIGTGRLILRKWRESDRGPFARMNCDPEVMEHFPAVLSRQESDALIDRADAHLQQHGFGPWAAELRESQQFVGFISLFIPQFEASFTPCVEIGWRLAREHWGKGLATEGARALVRHGFEVQGLIEVPYRRKQVDAALLDIRSHPRVHAIEVPHRIVSVFDEKRTPWSPVRHRRPRC